MQLSRYKILRTVFIIYFIKYFDPCTRVVLSSVKLRLLFSKTGIDEKQFSPPLCASSTKKSFEKKQISERNFLRHGWRLDWSRPKRRSKFNIPKKRAARLSVPVRESKTTERRSASRPNDQRGDDESPWPWVGVRPAGARERGHTSGHASRREIDGDR